MQSRVIVKKFGENPTNIYLRKQEIGPDWSSLTSKDSKQSFIGDNIELNENCHLLTGPNGSFLADRLTLELRYAIEGNMICKIAARREEKLILAKFPSTYVPSLTQFESPSCSFYWCDRDTMNLRQVELPRLGITLERKDEGDKTSWYWGQQEGWRLAEEQQLPGFGDQCNFLIFEKGGKKRVLLPVWEPIAEAEQNLTFKYNYEFNELNIRQGEYVVCEVEEGVVKPSSLSARYHLARIYLERGEIEKAQQLLYSFKAEEGTRPLTPTERRLLCNLATENSSHNASSQAIRLRMHALYLFAKNEGQFSKKVDKAKTSPEERYQEIYLKQKMAKLYTDYLDRIHEIKPLTIDVEKQILRFYSSLHSDIFNTTFEQHTVAKRRSDLLDGVDEALFKEMVITIDDPNAPFPKNQRGCVDNFFKENSFSSLAEKIYYRIKRAANTLPFDPKNATAQEIRPYFELLEKECNKTTTEKARKNGLMAAIYVMALFNQDKFVSDAAFHLWSSIQFSTENIEKNSAAIKPRSFTPRSLPGAMARDLQQLLPLEVLSKVDDALVDEFYENSYGYKDMVDSFFSKQRSQGGKVDADKLFKNTYPEVQGAAIEKEFDLMKSELEQADLSFDDYKIVMGQDIRSVRSNLEYNSKKTQKELADREYMLVNSVKMALLASSDAFIATSSKKAAEPTIDELCILCAQPDFDAKISKLYPQLEPGKEKLKRAAKDYLLLKQKLQKLQRSIRKYDDYITEKQKRLEDQDAFALQTLLNDLGRTLEAERAYDASEASEAMVFLLIETALDITLRTDQIEAIRKLAKGIETGDEIVLQMIMGAGKTFAIQPSIAYFLTLLRPKEQKGISAVIVPDALLAPVKEQLSKTLGNAFQQYVVYLPYTREIAKDCDYLQTFLEIITEAKEEGRCLLFTPKQKHSILTSLYESYADLEQAASSGSREAMIEVKKRNELIVKIANTLNLYELDQIDEVDLVMNPKVIFKYPIGDKEIVSANRVGFLSKILLDLALDHEFASNVSIDFIDAYRSRCELPVAKAAVINKELFATEVRSKLIEKALKRLGEQRELVDLLSSDNNEYVKHFLGQSTPYDHLVVAKWSEEEVAVHHLTLSKKSEGQLRAMANDENDLLHLLARQRLFKLDRNRWIETNLQNQELRELLGTCAHAINHILPISLFKECGSHYGLDPEKGNFVARPYEAPRAPKETLHSDPYSQACHSIQTLLFYGMPKEGARRLLSSLQKKAQLEMRAGGKSSLSDTKAYQDFKAIMGGEDIGKFRFFEMPASEEFVNAFQKTASKSPKALQLFSEVFLAPQIDVYKEELSSTPQTMKGSSNKAVGYTGTLHSEILARGMKPEREFGTDGKTMTAVQSKIDKGLAEVKCFAYDKDNNYAHQMIDKFMEDEKLYMFIDSGGWLKEENMDRYSEEFLNRCQASENRKAIKGIVYHDSKGQIICLEKEGDEFVRRPFSESKLKPQERITVIQKRYETGTNILQDPMAKVELSLGKKMEGDRLRQAIFRARQILQGQTLSIAMTKDVSDDIAQAITEGLLKKESFHKAIASETEITQETIEAIVAGLDLPQEAAGIKKSIKEALQNYAQTEAYQKVKGGQISFELAAFAFGKAMADAFKPDCESVWRYVTATQALSKREKNWQAGLHKMREVVERPLRMALANPELSQEKRLELFKLSRSLLVHTTKDSPFEQMMKKGEKMDAQTAIDRQIGHYKEIYENVIKNADKELEKIIEANVILSYGKEGDKAADLIKQELSCCMKKEEIPEVMEVGSEDQDGEVEVEVEVEVETDKEVEQEQEKEIESDISPLSLPQERLFNNLVSLRYDGGYEMSEFFSDYVGIYLENKLPIGFFSTKTKIEMSSNWMVSSSLIGTPRYTEEALPGRYLLALADDQNKKRYIIVSDNDAALIRKGMKGAELPPGCKAALFTFNGSVVSGKEQQADAFSKDIELSRVFQICKLISGKVNFNQDEANLLKEFIIAQKGDIAKRAAQLEVMYKQILKTNPEDASCYKGSFLNKMFEELKTAY